MTNTPRRTYRAITVDLRTALTDLRIAAEIRTSENGGPVRTIINGRHRKPVGRYASRKARRSLPWEAVDERAFFWLCEADPDVVGYLCQPHQLVIFQEDADPLVFYPDVQRDLADGTIEIVEVKKTFDDKDRGNDPSYLLKLELARQVYAGLGWGFRVVTGIEMRRGLRLRNAKAVQRSRFARFDAAESVAMLQAIAAAGGHLPFDEAAKVLGTGPRASAKLKAIIVNRVVRVDLDQRLNGLTAVKAALTTPLNPPDASAGRQWRA